jgi:hypothetical protein
VRHRQILIISNIKIQLLSNNGEELPDDLYAKVMGTLAEDSPGFVVHLTSIHPKVAAFFEGLMAARSPAHAT